MVTVTMHALLRCATLCCFIGKKKKKPSLKNFCIFNFQPLLDFKGCKVRSHCPLDNSRSTGQGMFTATKRIINSVCCSTTHTSKEGHPLLQEWGTCGKTTFCCTCLYLKESHAQDLSQVEYPIGHNYMLRWVNNYLK